jgi:uncharacterized protein (TIRG00374 family)
MTKSLRKYVIYFIILILVGVITFFLVLKDNFDETIASIAASNKTYLLGALGLLLLAYVVESLAITLITRLYYPKYRIYRGFFNMLVGNFFSGITPSATGGQVGQVYLFRKQGVSGIHSMSILLMNFIGFQLALVITASITLITSFSFFEVKIANVLGIDFLYLSLIGFGINFFVIAFLYLLAFSKRIHIFVTKYLIRFLAKLHIVKKPEKLIKSINIQTSNFRKEAKQLNKNIPLLLKVVGLHMFRLLILFSMPLAIYFALDQKLPDTESLFNFLWHVISLSSFVYLITSFFPVPGASGGAEGFFRAMFINTIFVPSLIGSALVLWRLMTFYFGLLIGFLVLMFYRTRGFDGVKVLDEEKPTTEITDTATVQTEVAQIETAQVEIAPTETVSTENTPKEPILE